MTDAAARSNPTPMAEVQALDALPEGPDKPTAVRNNPF